jgi:hypothetical protein
MKITTSKGQQIEITATRATYIITIDGSTTTTAECINVIKPVHANGLTYVATLKRVGLTAAHVAELNNIRATLQAEHYATPAMQTLRDFDASRVALEAVLRD